MLDATGKVIREARVASEPEALVAFLRGLGVTIVRVGLVAGVLSQWLYDGLKAAGYERLLLETRHVKAALSAMAATKGAAPVQPVFRWMQSAVGANAVPAWQR